jgi:hypothetical protein
VPPKVVGALIVVRLKIGVCRTSNDASRNAARMDTDAIGRCPVPQNNRWCRINDQRTGHRHRGISGKRVDRERYPLNRSTEMSVVVSVPLFSAQ